jgi:hypothetical protein
MSHLLREFTRRLSSAFLQAVVLVSLPLVVAARGAFSLLGVPRFSYWTGNPVLTLSQKAASERLLGERAIVIVRSTNRITNNFDVVLTQWCFGLTWLVYPLSGLTLIAMLSTASRVHAFADGGLLPPVRKGRMATAELLAYRLLGIPLLVWAYGADVRTRNCTMKLGPYNCCTDCTQVGRACVCDSKLGSANILRLRANKAILFSMGDMIEYTPGSRNNLFYWPLDLKGVHLASNERLQAGQDSGRRLRVVHAPNHREFKGTRYLEAAVSALQAEGVPIDLVLVEKLPNHEALQVYRTADVIFDQCLIGFHGYFALEAMALGKPVMCYIRKPLEYLLHPEECPIINTHVDTLKEDLRRLASSRDELKLIGLRSRQYVEQYFSQEAFASRLHEAYLDLGILKR